MKYLKILIILWIVLTNDVTFSQDFAPVGAEWYYTERFAWSGDIDYLMIKSIKDTVINGKPCKKLDCDGVCWNPSGIQFIHYANDSLFFLDSKLDSFQLLSAFNAQIGDTWSILIKDYDETIDTMTIRVDSLDSVEINGNNLRVLNITYHLVDYYIDNSISQDYSYTSKIIELIGDVDYFFNFPTEMGLMCDANRSEGLRCYEDSNLGFYSTGIADSCTYTYKPTGVENNIAKQEVKIYPNPTSDRVKLSGLDLNSIDKMELIDAWGRIHPVDKTSSTITLKGFDSGLYILRIYLGDKSTISHRLILN